MESERTWGKHRMLVTSPRIVRVCKCPGVGHEEVCNICGARPCRVTRKPRTNGGGTAKVDERPVVFLDAAEDVAGLDVPVGVPEVVQPPQSTHSMNEHLHTYGSVVYS